MRRADLLPYVEEVVELLRPACERLEIAGGIRREKAEPHDAEIVALPRWDTDLLGEPTDTCALLDRVIVHLVETGVLAWDTLVRRKGPRYKRFELPRPAVPLDLFLARADNYGNILAIRTGDAAFSHGLVTCVGSGGLMPRHLRQRDGYLWRGGERLSCPTEDDYFAALGLPAPSPRDRDEAMVRELRREVGAR